MTLRRNFTQTAISYEKTLKPFYKSLYEGTGTPLTPGWFFIQQTGAQMFFLLIPAASSPAVVCVPLLLPLLTLMERPSITPEGAELWETSDQGCDIMLRHLEAAREVAHNAHSYTESAQKVLQGKKKKHSETCPEL